MPASSLTPAEILALERQFLRDRERPDSTLRARDREIGRTLIAAAGGTIPPRTQLYPAWLEALGDEVLLDARRLRGAFRLLDLGLLITGLLMGSGSAAGLLHYDGSAPINLLHFLAVFVFLQVAMILLWVVALLFWGRGRSAPTGGTATAILGNLLRSLLRRALPAGRRDSLGRDLDWLRSVGGYYHNVERWLLARSTQLFALAFNLGAAAATIALMATSDLSFVWRSTIDWRPETLHRLLRLLAAPWAWLLPQAVPSLDLVAASRHFRGAGAPLLSPERLTTWWAFLLTALIVYGLLPRLLTWAIASLALRRTLRRLPLDHGDFEDLYERLTLPLVEMPGRETDPAAPPPPTAPRENAKPAPTRLWAIAWKDAPLTLPAARELLAERYGLPLEKLLRAGGGLDPAADQVAITALEALPPATDLVLLVEAFEAPTRELLGFLRGLRAATSRPLRILLLQPAPSGGWSAAGDLEVTVWRRGLQALRDPHLRVHTLARAADPSTEGDR